MSDAQQQLSPAMQALSEAVMQRQGQVRTALCGFGLWLQVVSSPFVKMREFRADGTPTDGSDQDGPIKIPVMVIGESIVVSLDVSLPPNGFELRT